MPPPIGEITPLWAVLESLEIILSLPDPPPEPLGPLTDVAILTAVVVLTERLSSEASTELRSVLPKIQARLKATGG
jgi:hypothetical protein